MRQNNKNNRSRGRGGRKGPNPLTRSYESNGPDVKVRGTAQHVAEKYQTLARDALASGDGIAAEAYFQHAEHYNRIIMTAQAQQNAAREEERRNQAQQAQAENVQPVVEAAPDMADAPQPAQTPPMVDKAANDSQDDNKPNVAAANDEQPKPRRRRAPAKPRRQPEKSADAPMNNAVSESAEIVAPAAPEKPDTIAENPPAFLLND